LQQKEVLQEVQLLLLLVSEALVKMAVVLKDLPLQEIVELTNPFRALEVEGFLVSLVMEQ
jgi:hypothetical protein